MTARTAQKTILGVVVMTLVSILALAAIAAHYRG